MVHSDPPTCGERYADTAPPHPTPASTATLAPTCHPCGSSSNLRIHNQRYEPEPQNPHPREGRCGGWIRNGMNSRDRRLTVRYLSHQ